MALTPEDSVTQIMRDEGFRGKPYIDSLGKTTIAYGINLDDHPLTEDEGRMLTEHRVAKIEDQLSASFPWYDSLQSLNNARKAVLIGMAYNLGLTGLLGFKKTLAFIEAEDYESAADEMLDSRWAVQVGARAQRLSVQMCTGKWT